MNKNEYLDRLSRLLADISYEEHEEALSYYREYIEDAGAENEQRVIKELGTPEHLAQEIREGLSNKGEPSKHQGEPINAPELSKRDSSEDFDTSYRDTQHSYHYDHDNHNGNNRNTAKSEKDKSNTVLIIIVLILTSPIWFSLACTVISAIFGSIVAVLAVAVSIGVVGVVCMIAGIALIVAGISAFLSITVFSVPSSLAGTALIGAGLIVLALGIVFLVSTVWIFGWALPACVRLIRQTISRISRKKKEAHV